LSAKTIGSPVFSLTVGQIDTLDVPGPEARLAAGWRYL
jgi:hypothetical protein